MEYGNVLRKVFAVVTANTFQSFRDRCKAEGVKLDEVLTGMISLYANGGKIIADDHTKRKIRHEVSEVFNYKNEISKASEK